jgi:hypothetical protein
MTMKTMVLRATISTIVLFTQSIVHQTGSTVAVDAPMNTLCPVDNVA